MEITQDIIDDFQEYYPEFDNSTGQAQYSDALIERLLCEADEETGSRWGNYTDGNCSLKKRGMFAYVGHFLSLRTVANRASSAGGVASAAKSVSSKSVGDESIGYEASAQGYALGDNFGTTLYGQEFVRLRRRAGMGALVV